MIPQTACVVGGGDKAAAQRIHLCQRGYHACIAEVIRKFPSCQARTGCRLNCDNLIILLATQLFAHEGRNQTAQIGAAACTADDDIRLDAVFIECCLCFHTDDGLMQQNLIQHAAQNITIALLADCRFYGFGNGTAKAARCAGMLRQNLLPDFRCGGGGRGYGCAIGTHDLAAEGLLLIGNLNHVYVAVQTQICTRHGKRCAPLPCAGFCCHALQALLLCIIRLRDGRIQLMAATGVIALELIINLCGCLQFFFQTICTNQRRWSVHFIKIQNFLWDVDVSSIVI